MIIDLSATSRPGLYVIEFPSRVKIGRSINVLGRVGQHGRAGGLRAWLSPGMTPFDALVLERRALRVACERVGRPYEHPHSESFQVPFEEAVELVLDVLPTDLIARALDVPLELLTDGEVK